MRSYLGQSLAGGGGSGEVLLGTVAGGGDRMRAYLGQSLAGVIE